MPRPIFAPIHQEDDPLPLIDPSPLSPQELARLGLNRFATFDVETTGLDSSSCRIIELGAVRYEGGEERARFSELVRVDEPLPPFITRLTGISDDDLVDAKPFDKLAGDILEFLGDDPVIGQNVRFDLEFLEAELTRLPDNTGLLPPAGDIHDTLTLARTLFPVDIARYGLGALARQLDVSQETAHRAVNDAAMTGSVLLALLERGRRLPQAELREMLRILGATHFTLGAILDGLLAIGPGDAGPWIPPTLADNRIGSFGGEDVERRQAPEPEQIGADTYAHWFAEDGDLSKQVEGYKVRQGQVDMAWDVHQAMEQGEQLICEAGTGTGKSLAYLLPSLVHARAGRGRVVISTNTRHLQNQLFEKDLPALAAAFGGDARAVLLKGRGNYICKRRYEALVQEPDSLDGPDRAALLPIVHWLARTKTGDIGEAPGVRQSLIRGLWSRLSADSGFCSNRVCRASKGCFLHRARMSAQAADIVLINHALLFSDLASDGGVLGEYDRLIVDEAHHIEDTAAQHLGLRFHVSALRMTLLQLHDPKGNRAGLLMALRALQPMLETPLERQGEDKPGPVDRIIEILARTLRTADIFHAELYELVTTASGDGNRRQPAGGGYARQIRYTNGEETFAALKPSIETLRESLRTLLKELKVLREILDEADDALVGGDDIVARLGGLTSEITEHAEAFTTLTGPAPENLVLWYSIGRDSRAGVTLQAAPLDVSAVLREMLYPNLETLVLTSATLTVNGSFDFIRGRLGLSDAKGVSYPSPFDMKEQLYVAVADFLGTPRGAEMERYTEGVARLAGSLPIELDAGALVLFTSQKMLGDAYDQAAPVLERQGWSTFAQGVGASQAEMLDRFRGERTSVLFGVDSFWEGIDVPGESLELLIIAKLPFHVPTDPLVEARSEQIKARGGNPFIEYTVPEATLRLRQGLGRLIRRTDDVGVAVICDPRIVTSRWGKMMASSLPVPLDVFHDPVSLQRALIVFLDGEEALDD